MNAILRELRFAGRRLLARPGSSAVAVFAMALGIGLTTVMYSIIDGALLRGLPFERAERLMHLECNNLARDEPSLEVTPHDFEVWRDRQQSFEGLAGFTSGTFNLSDRDELPERYNGAWISPGFLELLRVSPARGRAFEPADERPGAAPVVLLGHHVWQQRYGGDPAIVGRAVRINSEPTTVIGVLPQGFRFPIDHDLWMPLVPETSVPRGEGTTLEVFGRLRDGVTLDRAASEMTLVARQLEQQYPETNEGLGVVIKPYVHEYVGDDTRQLLGVMFAAVLLVLLIACLNVANLLLGRASERGRELAIRSALGAGRGRAIVQVLAESGLLALAGAAFGVLLAGAGLRVFAAAMARVEVPFWFHFALSGEALLFTFVITLLAALAAGLLPALRATRIDLNPMLQDATRGTSVRLGRLSRAMVVAEVAISCALLLGAGLMVRSVLVAQSYDLRFETENLLSARLGLFEGDYPEEQDWVRFYERLRERVAARPEVEHAAIGTVLPAEMQIGAGNTWYQRPGEVYEQRQDMPFARLVAIGPGYFETLGTPILAGRDFTAADREGAPTVALVNASFASREWPDESPIGQRVDLWMDAEREAEDPEAGRFEVVGVVPDLRFSGFDNEDDQYGIYVPIAQYPMRFAWIISRTRGDAAAFAEPLRRTVLELDPDLPLYYVRTMDQVLSETLFYPNLLGVLFTVFGVVAVVLASIGLYGVMAFAVTRRTREMGVRMAFGARARDLLGLVLGQGLRQVALGLAFGLTLGAGLAGLLGAFLFRVQPADPLTFGLVPALLVAVAAAACLVPARRAAGTDPIEALRQE